MRTGGRGRSDPTTRATPRGRGGPARARRGGRPAAAPDPPSSNPLPRSAPAAPRGGPRCPPAEREFPRRARTGRGPFPPAPGVRKSGAGWPAPPPQRGRTTARPRGASPARASRAHWPPPGSRSTSDPSPRRLGANVGGDLRAKIADPRPAEPRGGNERGHIGGRSSDHPQVLAGDLLQTRGILERGQLQLEPIVLAGERAVLGLELGELIAGTHHQHARAHVDDSHRGEEHTQEHRGEQVPDHRRERGRLAAHRTFSTARRCAERALGLASTSASEAVMAFLVRAANDPCAPHTHTGSRGGHLQRPSRARKACFTLRSSREWKVTIAATPPRRRIRGAASSAASSASSSRFTAMRSAWKVRVATWIFFGHALRGTARFTASAASSVVRGNTRLSSRAMERAKDSSPYSLRIRSS